ncbi:hypothetical protein [Thermus sp. 93170]|uniref:hypothetical protein n=1 Tax=Thermus sp. 93170 TaxID=1046939 RepID=UPI003F42CD04
MCRGAGRIVVRVGGKEEEMVCLECWEREQELPPDEMSEDEYLALLEELGYIF